MRRREWDRCTDPAAMLRAVSFPPDALPPAHRAAMLRRLRVFTLTAAQPVLDRVNYPACHAAAAVGWRVAEGVASDDEVAAANEQLRAAWVEGMGAARHYFEAPPEVWALPRLVNVLALLFTERAGRGGPSSGRSAVPRPPGRAGPAADPDGGAWLLRAAAGGVRRPRGGKYRSWVGVGLAHFRGGSPRPADVRVQ